MAASKVWTYVFIITGIMILFTLAGLNTSGGYVIGVLGLGDSTGLTRIQETPLWSKIIWGLGILAGITAVIVGIFGRSISTLPISAGIASGFLLLFVGDLISIISFVEGWERWILVLIIAPLVIGFLLAIYEWVIGRD